MGKKFQTAVFMSLILASCFSIKPQVSKTGKNLWEDFFVSPGVMQYFIKPLEFKNKEGNIDIDFTFRNDSDSVTVNYSIYSDQVYTKPEMVIISNELITINIFSPKTLISEMIQKKYKLRQTGKISLAEFKTLIKNNFWTVNLQNGNKKDQYFASQKTKEKIKSIDEHLMIMLDN